MNLEELEDYEQEIEFLSFEELMALPPITWLMDKMIPERAVVAVYGPPGEGKSFIVLDWAACISEGMPWQGHATKQAPVVYVAAEGGRGIKKRFAGLAEHYGVSDFPAMYYLLDPLSLRDDEVIEDFLDALERIDVFPGLVIIDTLSQTFGGGDENSSADMGKYMIGIRRLAARRHMAVLVVHHTNATGARERGHTALRGNVDVMFACHSEKNGDGRIVRLTLKNDKQKDDADLPAMYFQPKNVRETLVFEPTDPPERKKRGEGPPAVPTKASMLTVLESHAEGMTFTEWLYAAKVPKRTFQRRLKQLELASEIYKEEGRYFAMPSTEDLAEVAEGPEN